MLHDLGAAAGVADPLDDPVEGPRPDHLAERELEVEGREIVLERDQFLAARRLVDAVHDRRLLRLQRAGGGDVGGDHIVLDQPVRVEPVARRDRGDAPLLVEHHAALGNVELERLALVAGGEQRAPARPERLQRGADQLVGNGAFDLGHRAGRRGDFDPFLARRIDRGLCILVGNVCGDANLRARKSPALERAVLGDLEVAGHRRAHLAFLQRADVGGQFLRQHRHDAVGEIDAVAARPRLAVELGAGADVEADVGDGDDRLPPALVVLVIVRRGPDGVVMVARIGGVDGDDRQMRQVLALAELLLRHAMRLVDRLLPEFVAQAVLVDGDEAEAARRERVAEHGIDPRRHARRPSRDFAQHEVARLRVLQVG